jgi:hypothetical protein
MLKMTATTRITKTKRFQCFIFPWFILQKTTAVWFLLSEDQ